MPPSPDWEKPTLFVFGTVFFIVLLAIAWLDPHPSTSSWYVYIWVLAMAAGGVAALLPGAINVNLNPGIRASGALAMAVLVFYFGKDRAVDTTVQNMKSHLDAPQGQQMGGIDPSSDVYVVINSKLAAYDKGGQATEHLDFGKNDWKGAKKVFVDRGAGGIQILYSTLSQGDKVDVIAKDSSGLWRISNDMVVPEGELGMRDTTFSELKARFENGP